MEHRKRRLAVIMASAALAGGAVLGAATSAYAADAGGPNPSRVIGHSQGGDEGGGNQLNQGGGDQTNQGGGNQANQRGPGNQANQGGGYQLNRRGSSGPYTTWPSYGWGWVSGYWVGEYWVPGHWERIG